MPVDEIKLDQSFTADVDTNVRAQAVLSATVELGRNLGLDVIAEGIENTGTLAEVKQRGVLKAQGFYFSRPMPSHEIQELLAERGRSQATEQETLASNIRSL